MSIYLSIVMLESRHRKWQGVSVSDFWALGVWCERLLPFDGAQDERTGGLGIGLAEV